MCQTSHALLAVGVFRDIGDGGERLETFLDGGYAVGEGIDFGLEVVEAGLEDGQAVRYRLEGVGDFLVNGAVVCCDGIADGLFIGFFYIILLVGKGLLQVGYVLGVGIYVRLVGEDIYGIGRYVRGVGGDVLRVGRNIGGVLKDGCLGAADFRLKVGNRIGIGLYGRLVVL